MEIYLEGISVSARIGVHPWEQAIDQQLLIDLRCPCPDGAGQVDQLVTTVDYEALVFSLRIFVQSQSWQLLETLHRALAVQLHQEFSLPFLYLRIEKPFALHQTKKVAIANHYAFTKPCTLP